MGLTILRFAQSLLLPINVTTYAEELEYYSDKVKKAASTASISSDDLNFADLDSSILQVLKAAQKLEKEIEFVYKKLECLKHGHKRDEIESEGGKKFCHKFNAVKFVKEIKSINERLRRFEGGFIDQDGLKGREWYKHLGVAPGRYLGYGQFCFSTECQEFADSFSLIGSTTFPGLTEAITLDNSPDEANEEIDRLSSVLQGIAKGLGSRPHKGCHHKKGWSRFFRLFHW
jgi:N-acetylated-alpha-linked acidic dipeptidase